MTQGASRAARKGAEAFRREGDVSRDEGSDLIAADNPVGESI